MSAKEHHNNSMHTRTQAPPAPSDPNSIPKLQTGIPGLDEILKGGLPANRTTLIKGSAGTGKTVLGLECLYRAALRGEPVLFISFEESEDAVRRNAAATGWDLAPLEKAGKFFLWNPKIDYPVLVSGDFSIESLLAMIGAKADQLGASTLMIDAIDVLTQIFNDPFKERNQLCLLHDWLKDRRFTALLTAKMPLPREAIRRNAPLDYMADCVLHLDMRVMNQVSTRRLRVIKYRGSGFCSNEYPYIITENGSVIFPITAVGLGHKPLGGYITTGSTDLDRALGGGYRQSSCIVITGPTGCGKTTLASTFARAACQRGDKALFVSFEESRQAVIDAMRSPGIDLQPALDAGQLLFHTVMPEALVAEEHLYRLTRRAESFAPAHIILDAVSACVRMGSQEAAFDFIIRLIHFCKERGITCLMTNLTQDRSSSIPIRDIASVIDTLISISYSEKRREIRRELLIVKSRAAHHSNCRMEYIISDDGIRFVASDAHAGGKA